MLELIRDFPEQMLRAIEIGEKVKLQTKFANGIKNVLVCGLGGSGIGGNLVSELLRDELKVPVTVNKGYLLPAFADASTLLILCSYSGNTEETLHCAELAVEKGLKPVCVTSGGKLAEMAAQNNWDVINIPGGSPPRACLGYSAIQLFFVLSNYGLINPEFKASLIRSSSFLTVEQAKINEDAEFLAAKLLQKVIIVYAEDKYESTALRLKQQVNENAKMHSWYNVIPEMNHNELVGWREPVGNLAVLIFRSSDEFHRNTHRILFNKDVVVKVSDHVYEIDAKGKDTYEKHFYLIHLGDWLTYHLALLQGYEPMEIDVLNKLKGHMSSIK